MRAMIFDLDGVLVDTAHFHYQAWKRLAREWFDMDLTPEDNERFKGVNREACMHMLCEMADVNLERARFEQGMALKNAWYVNLVNGMTPADVLPGARAFVERQKQAGVLCAIGSASKNCSLVLERTGLQGLFDAVSDGTVVTRAKPDPEVFVTAARMLQVLPARCVVFEDAQAGIEAARAGGMRCCAIGQPHNLQGYDWIFPSLQAAGSFFDDLRST
ncbi:MAG: beta-phosphoglucomutase [Clostridiales bacterium]|nr:beta-phosphoglucomutase [Clostridiales bacterium]